MLLRGRNKHDVLKNYDPHHVHGLLGQLVIAVHNRPTGDSAYCLEIELKQLVSMVPNLFPGLDSAGSSQDGEAGKASGDDVSMLGILRGEQRGTLTVPTNPKLWSAYCSFVHDAVLDRVVDRVSCSKWTMRL